MAITQQTPYNNYTGNGSTTVFAYTFKLFLASDLKVYLDGVLKTIATDYTISGVGDESGGSVTFLTAPAASVDVILVRSIPYDRLVDYQTSGDLLADTLDDDLDRMEAQLQQLAAYGGVLLQSDLPLAPYNANGRRIINVAQPTEASDAVNKAYLDAAIAGYPENTSFIISNVAITANTTYTEPVVVLPGGMFTISSGVTLTINGPFSTGDYQVFTGSGTVTGLKEARPEWFGANGMGKAITSLADGGVLRFSGGTYAITERVSATLTGSQRWIADGETTIKYSGGEITEMVLVVLAGYDLNITGPCTFDANRMARTALRVNSTTTTMGDAANITLDGISGINAYSTDVVGHRGSTGLHIHGGYDTVSIKNCAAKNISRLAGVGTPGVTSSAGIAVTSGGINAYARSVVIEDPVISDVYSEELDGAPNNTDCDGLFVSGPAASLNGGIPLDTTLVVRGGRYINCRGRSIKSQMERNTITNPTFVRNAAGMRSIQNGLEVDFQYGSGTLRDFKCIYEELSGGGTPFGDSFSVITATVRSTYDARVLISGGEIFSHVSAAIDYLPYFLSLASVDDGATSTFFNTVHVTGINFYGEPSGVSQFVRGPLGRVRNLTVTDNYFIRLSDTLVYSTTDPGSLCNAVLQNNVQPYSSSATLYTIATGTPPVLLDPKGNVNFNGFTTSEIGECISLADDATYTFAKHRSSVFGLYSIANNFSAAAQALFAVSTTVIVDMSNGLATSVVYGTAASPPDTDGKLNVWMDAGYRINIKNRLGSTRTFCLRAL